MDLKNISEEIRAVQGRHRARPEMVKGLNVPYFRRGEMAIPAFKMKTGGDPATDGRATSLKLMKKVTELPVDFFFYDLEDASPDHLEFKDHARSFVIEALTTFDFGNRVVAFRPNNIRTEYFEQDLIRVVTEAGHRLDAMVIPKTEYADELKDIIGIVNAIQKKAGHTNRISFEVLIESPTAFLDAEKIAALDQVTSLIFGAWDFARTTGARVEPDSWTHDQAYARQHLPIVAAAYGKDAVDAVTGTLPLRPKKPEGVSAEEYAEALQGDPGRINAGKFGLPFIQQMRDRIRAIRLAEEDAADARRCGYAAKWILHPDQIEPIQKAWTPTREGALNALKLTAAYARAARTGSGAEVDGNRLADKAVVGTDWWIVLAALKGSVLTESDIKETGFTLQQLKRTVVTHDNHLSQA
ncbi:MAG: aldolase/citrate lyase family protein [Ignavibacteria bacterium]|nr:aldolase/citrate lyase family protein [Ignavibacteria bacterium]